MHHCYYYDYHCQQVSATQVHVDSVSTRKGEINNITRVKIKVTINTIIVQEKEKKKKKNKLTRCTQSLTLFLHLGHAFVEL